MRRWAGRDGQHHRLVAATDASYKSGVTGYAYLITDGRWGLHGWASDPRDPTGPARVLVNELRAVELLLSSVDEATTLLVLVDSRSALSYLHSWQQGRLDRLPDGYDTRTRTDGGTPTLVRLAEQVACRAGLTFTHVHSHRGHLLNEAADALSSMARRRVSQEFDIATRAHGLVDAFLRDWHRAAGPPEPTA